MELSIQTLSGANDMSLLLPDEAQPFAAVAANLASFGLAVEQLRYSRANKGVELP